MGHYGVEWDTCQCELPNDEVAETVRRLIRRGAYPSCHRVAVEISQSRLSNVQRRRWRETLRELGWSPPRAGTDSKWTPPETLPKSE